MNNSPSKWPRHYAAEICDMKTKAERRKALELVPEHWKDLVKKHVEITFAIQGIKR